MSGLRVWFVFGSCLVRVRFVSVSCSVRVWFVSYNGFVLGLVRIWIRGRNYDWDYLDYIGCLLISGYYLTFDFGFMIFVF